MTPLEARYRRLLRLLPREHRCRWEEDMVETFLAAEVASWPGDLDDDDRELAHLLGRPALG